MGLEGPAGGGDEGVVRLAGSHLHGVVEHADADAPLAEVVELAEVPIGRMPGATVRLNDDSVGVLKGAEVAWPAVVIGGDEDFVSVQGIEEPLREMGTGVVLVHPGGVAGTARDVDDLFHLAEGETLQAEVAELDLHGRSGVELQGKESGAAAGVGVVVGDLGHHRAVDLADDLVALGDDPVGVPIVLLDDLGEFGGIAEAAGDLGFAVFIDDGLFSALGEDSAESLAVVRPGPLSGGVDVGLVTADGVGFVEGEAADLESGIPAENAVFGNEFEVVELAIGPFQEGVVGDRTFGGGLTGDGAILDPPEFGIPFPTGECRPIEEREEFVVRSLSPAGQEPPSPGRRGGKARR